jgi:hypothetical protein
LSDPSTTLRLPIESSFSPTGTDAALAALKKLQAAQQQAAPKGAGGADQAAARAAVAQQKLATETQRTAVVTNQAAVAAQRLSTEEQRTAAAVQNAAAAQARAEIATLRLAKAQDQAATASQRGANFAQQLGQAYTSSLTSIIGPAAIAAASIKAVSEAGQLAKIGAQAQQTEQRFDDLAKTAGTTGDTLMNALRSASAGTISDLNLQLAANKSQLLGVADSAEEFSVLMEIARDRAQQMGISTQFAFDSIVTGLGHGSALILDNIGITIEVAEVNEAYAASLGKTVAQLTEGEKKQALINAVVAQGKASLEAAGGAAETNATKLERLAANWENLTTKVGGFLANTAAPTVDALNQMATAADRAAEQSGKLLASASDYDAYTAAVKRADEAQLKQIHSASQGIPNEIEPLSEAQFNYAKALEATGVSAAEARAKAIGLNDTFIQIGEVQAVVARQSGLSTEQLDQLSNTILRLEQAGGEGAAQIDSLVAAFMRGDLSSRELAAAAQIEPALAAQAAAAEQAAVASQVHTSSMDLEITAALQAGLAQQQQAQAAVEAAYASQTDAAAKQEQAAQTELLTAQSTAAADAFMMLHPNISASGVASLVTAGQIDPLLAQLVMARIRASEASAELARFRALAGVQALAAPRRGQTDADEIRAGKRDMAQDLRESRVRGAQEAEAAEIRYQQALGNYGPAVQRAKTDLVQIGKTRGTDSAEYINQLTKITQLEGQAASAAKKNAPGGGGGRAAGGGGVDKAAKAAEATATRLSDIARQGGNKLADIEEATHSKLAAIDAKYAEQRAEAQRALFDEIARMSTGEAYSQQLNDFEQFGKDLSDEQKALFQAREQAEVRYNERIRQAQEQAKAEAVSGDADLAAEKLKIREAEAKRQMEIEQRAAQASIDSEGKNAAAIAKEAQEASAESKAIADTDIAIAEAKAAEKAGAMQAEKDAVIAAAEEQKNKVIEAATEQASKVKGASDDQKSTVISNLRAQADAAGDWADAIEAASRRAGSAMGGVTGPPAAEGGDGGGEGEGGGAPAPDGGGEPSGQGIAGGRRSARRVAGASEGGGGSLTDAIQTLNDAAEILKILKPFVASNKGAVKLLNEYKLVVQSAVGSLLAIQDLRERLVQPQPVLDLAVVAKLKPMLRRSSA